MHKKRSMKKTILILTIALTLATSAHAQFIQGFGIFAGGNSSRERIKNLNELDATNTLGSVPQSTKGREYESWLVGISLELLNFDRFKWRTEAEYTHKGSHLNEMIDPFTSTTSSGTNKFTYIEWNNFLKFQIEGYKTMYYGLIGIRAEYNLSKSTPAYSYIIGNFKKIWANPDIGIGTELLTWRKLKLFGELHYNPDILKQYNKSLVWANNRTWEVRIGLMFRKKKMLDIDCNAPRYTDPY
jgi:hypothetical protein